MVTIFSFECMTGENRELCEMLRAEARLQCVSISEIVAGDIALLFGLLWFCSNDSIGK